MYANYIEDRKALKYEVLKNTSCGIKLKLVLIRQFNILSFKLFIWGKP